MRTTAIILALAPAVWAASMAGVRAQAPKTVWLGAFSNAQADRGGAVYSKECTTCHSDNFRGKVDGGPPLVGKDFEMRWADRSLLDIVTQVSELMPADEPATLTRKDWVELFAFLFRANGATMAAADLPLDEESLAAVMGTNKPRP